MKPNNLLIILIQIFNIIIHWFNKLYLKFIRIVIYKTNYSNLKPIFTNVLNNYIAFENLRQDRLNTEFHKHNLWKMLSNSKDKFIFLDLGFMPEFEYRIEQYFSINSNFYGVDADPETINYKKKENQIIINKLVATDNFSSPPGNYLYSAIHNCNIQGDSLDPSKEIFLKIQDNEKIKKDKNDVIRLKSYFKNINLDFVKTDLDSMDMAALYDLEDKLKSKEILGLSVEVQNCYEDIKNDNLQKINTFAKVFNYLNYFGYRLFDHSNIKMLRKSARNYKFKKIYNSSDWVNSEKGQLAFGDYLFFLDPLEVKNKLTIEKKIKLISLLDCYDFPDVVLELINSEQNLINENNLKEDIKKILIERIESDYRNFNPLNLREIYLKGSTNKTQ